MYEENRGRFTVRDIILQILIVALFIFILIWLFPTKGFISSKVDPLLDTIFNTNVMSMKDSAESYYTLERLPKNKGDKVKMTLRKMLEEKIILPFNDRYGEECDLDKSYVEIEKKENEYVMKVNLKCSRQEDYILVHMGCYDYCQNTLCQTVNTEITDKKGNPVKPVVPTTPEKPIVPPTNPDKPVVPTKKYVCEYGLKKNGYYTAWSDWSEWTTTKITVPTGQEKLMEVQTKVETKQNTTDVLTGYSYQEVYDGSKPIYEYKNMVVGTREITTTTSCEVVTTTTTTTTTYGNEVLMGIFQTNAPVGAAPAGNRYEKVNQEVFPCDANCSITTVYTYKWYAKTAQRTTSTQTTSGWEVCNQSVRYEPITKSVKILVGLGTSYKRIPVYSTAVTNLSRTLYQSRTRKFVAGTSELKWSNCSDSGLLNNGWVLTGNKKEA